MTELSNERLAEMLAGLEGVTPGPWAYRPWQYDDWGTVRAPQGNGHDLAPFVANVRAGRQVSEDELLIHRQKRTDPYGANAEHIARCDPDTMRSILTELLSLRQSHSTGVVVNAALVERFQSAYRDAGQKRNWHPTWPDAEASFEILSALYTNPKEAEVTVTEEMVERALQVWFDQGVVAERFHHQHPVAMRAALVAALSRKG